MSTTEHSSSSLNISQQTPMSELHNDDYLQVYLWELALMIPVDCLLYALLAFYCDKVLPGEFGAKEKWSVLFLSLSSLSLSQFSFSL